MDPIHKDEHDRACTRHPVSASDQLLALAVLGARAPSFHHDIASKLQALMMAIDELTEIAGNSLPPLTRAIDTADVALEDVLELLNRSRALTKAPSRTRTTLSELLARSGERVHVNLRGAIPSVNLEVSVPWVTHALALVLDVAGGPGRGRWIDAAIALDGSHTSITLTTIPEAPSNASDLMALASFVLVREGGELRCAGDGRQIVVRLSGRLSGRLVISRRSARARRSTGDRRRQRGPRSLYRRVHRSAVAVGARRAR